MFGHQDDKKDDKPVEQNDEALNEIAQATGGEVSDGWQHPGTPIDDDQVSDDVISPAGGFPKAPTVPAESVLVDQPLPQVPTTPPMPSTDEATTHELIDIKQKALTELLPLIDQLDQPPEEKFRTIMMMIQASDDERLIKIAYETAHNIPDEKAKARALLDIVNEINYFTQQPQN